MFSSSVFSVCACSTVNILPGFFWGGVVMILNVCPNNISEYLRIFLHSFSSCFKGLAGVADRLGFALRDVLWTAAVSRWTRSPDFRQPRTLDRLWTLTPKRTMQKSTIVICSRANMCWLLTKTKNQDLEKGKITSKQGISTKMLFLTLSLTLLSRREKIGNVSDVQRG